MTKIKKFGIFSLHKLVKIVFFNFLQIQFNFTIKIFKEKSPNFGAKIQICQNLILEKICKNVPLSTEYPVRLHDFFYH